MKKSIALIMALILVVSLAACGSGEASAEVTTEQTTEPTVEATTEATTEATEEPTESTEAQTDPEVDYESIAAAVEASGAKMHYWNVDVIGEAFFITFAYNGMSDAVKAFKDAGYDENNSDWISAKETILSLYQSSVDLIIALGVEDPMCFMNLVNENDHAEIFVSVYNGEVTFDIMAE